MSTAPMAKSALRPSGSTTSYRYPGEFWRSSACPDRETTPDTCYISYKHHDRHRLAHRPHNSQDQAGEMPERDEEYRCWMVSHFVAPSAVDPSRRSAGTPRIDSRERATTVGRIMIARTVAASGMPSPLSLPDRNKGINPRVFPMNGLI